MTAVLAHIPFLHPMSVFHGWWYLLLPVLALGIAMVYKALRLHTLETYWRQVLIMTAQVVLAMIALAVLLAIVVQIVIPLVPID